MFGWAAQGLDFITGRDIANKNYNLDKQNLAYQKELQQEIFAREDNAVQRRMRDLEAAGLSKTLAAGGSANAGAIVPTKAPQKEYTAGRGIDTATQAAALALDVARSRADISKTVADTAVSRQTANKLKSDTLNTDLTNEYLSQTMTDRIIQQVVTTDQKKLDYLNSELDSQIKKNNIQIQEIEKTKAALAVEGARLGLTSQQIEIVAKQLTLSNSQYDSAWYQNWGLPTNAGLDPAMRQFGIFSNVLKGLNPDNILSPEDIKKAKAAESRGVQNSRGGAR